MITASEDADTRDKENYNYRNKNISRQLNKAYLGDEIPDPRNKTVLLLSSWQGLDLKQIFYPLGFRRNNVYVVERDKRIYELMRVSDAFRGTRLIHSDLKDFRTEKKFDVIYLDFKCQICDEALDNVRRLLIKNAKVGTSVYLNFLARREKGAVSDKYKYIEDLAIKCVDEISTRINGMMQQEEEIIERISGGIALAMGIKDPKMVETLKENDALRVELFNNLAEGKKGSTVNVLRGFEKMKKKNQYQESAQFCARLKDMVELRGNDHVIRQAFLEKFVRDSLSMIIKRYHRHTSKSNGDIVEIYSSISPPIDETDEELASKRHLEHRLITWFLRFLTDSPIIRRSEHYFYMGKKRSPFLSFLFSLGSPRDILERIPKTKLHESFVLDIPLLAACSFHLLHLYYKKELKWSALCSGIKEFMRRSIQDEGVSPEDEAGTRIVENATRDQMIDVKRLYSNLRRHGLLSVNKRKVSLFALSHSGEEVRYEYDISRDLAPLIFKLGTSVVLLIFWACVDAFSTSHDDGLLMHDLNLKTPSVVDAEEGGTLNLYIRSPSPLDKDMLKGMGRKGRSARNALIRDYIEEYGDEMLSGEIAGKINAENFPIPFVSDYEVRGHKIWKKREEYEDGEYVSIQITESDLQLYTEGDRSLCNISRVERDPRVRARAIEIHGHECQVCGYIPENKYEGQAMDLGLQIHHKEPLSESGEMLIDPMRDVNVVCALCHILIHSGTGRVLTVREARSYLIDETEV